MEQSTHHVTQAIARARDGDEDAARLLFERYYHRLTGLARKRLTTRRRIADENDIVQDVLQAFFLEVQEDDGFPDLRNREDLQRLLLKMTKNQAITQIRRESRKKDGAEGRQRHPSDTNHQSPNLSQGGVDHLVVRGESCFADAEGEGGINEAPDPSPDFDAFLTTVNDEWMRVLNAEEVEVFGMCLDGLRKAVIAEAIGKSVTSVERILGKIQRKWLDAGFIYRPFDYARRMFRDLDTDARLILHVKVTDPDSRESVVNNYRLTFMKLSEHTEKPLNVELKVRADEPLRYQSRDGKWQERIAGSEFNLPWHLFRKVEPDSSPD